MTWLISYIYKNVRIKISDVQEMIAGFDTDKDGYLTVGELLQLVDLIRR